MNAVLIGLAIAPAIALGSFLNVVIHRVPRGMSVVRPASHCPACNKPIRAWDNIPVLGYLLLRGKAPCRGAKLPPRHPMVEAIRGVLPLALLAARRAGGGRYRGVAGRTSDGPGVARAIGYLNLEWARYGSWCGCWGSK